MCEGEELKRSTGRDMGETLASRAGCGEPRAGMQEMEADSKAGECSSLKGCKKS